MKIPNDVYEFHLELNFSGLIFFVYLLIQVQDKNMS